MDFLQQLQERFSIDVTIIVLVLLSGFFQSRYLCKLVISKDEKFDGAIKTLFVSAIVSTVYILLAYEPENREWAKYFFSYFTATSIYEVLVRPFLKMLEKIGGPKDEPEVKVPQTPHNDVYHE